MDGAETRRLSKMICWRIKLMKKFLLGTVALVALGATVPALAADLAARPAYTKAPAYVQPIYNWTGFYIGGHIGGAFDGSNGFIGTNSSSNNGRFLGGLQIGADYQFAPNWVLGVEGQWSWLGNNNNGIAFPGYSESLTLFGVPQAFALNSSHHDGFTVGAGLEYMFAQNWSAKAEYQYYNFGKTNFLAPLPLPAFGSTRNDEHTFKVGLNYRFNWGGPVVARY